MAAPFAQQPMIFGQQAAPIQMQQPQMMQQQQPQQMPPQMQIPQQQQQPVQQPFGQAPVAAPAAVPVPAPVAAAAPASPLFALLIPGRVLDTNWQMVDAKKMQIEIAQPLAITELSVCMLQPSIPADHGVAIFYAIQPFTDWQYLGHINLQYPTASFRSVWRDKIPPNTPSIRLGLSVEPLTTIAQLPPADAKEEERSLDSAKGIAKDLYDFMASYSHNSGQYRNLGDVLVIPTNCIDKWFEKFQNKHRANPYFWLKTDTRKVPTNH